MFHMTWKVRLSPQARVEQYESHGGDGKDYVMQSSTREEMKEWNASWGRKAHLDDGEEQRVENTANEVIREEQMVGLIG